MANNQRKYRLLRRDSLEHESDDQTRESGNLTRPGSTFIILSIVLAISLCVNGFFMIYTYAYWGKGTQNCDGRSYYAGLKRNTPIPIYPSTEFVSDDNNITEVAQLWEELSGDPGVVALPQEFVSKKGLPEAMRFPWDTNKGVYLLEGFHSLHCLRTLSRYAWAAERGLPQRIAFIHIQHCLDQLRQEVICNADDTPRYAGFQDPPGTGAGQIRMCRNWAELEKWALERTACFKHEDEVPGRMVDRFKFCPDGRVLWPTGDTSS